MNQFWIELTVNIIFMFAILGLGTATSWILDAIYKKPRLVESNTWQHELSDYPSSVLEVAEDDVVTFSRNPLKYVYKPMPNWIRPIWSIKRAIQDAICWVGWVVQS